MQIFKVIFLSVIVLFIIVLAVYLAAWKRPEYFLQVDESSLADNNIDEKESLVVFNSGFKQNPDDQIKQFEEKWNSLKPDIVLIEGTLGFFIPVLMDPVKKFGIDGMAYSLAEQNNTKVYSYALPVEKITEKLLNKYPPEQIAVSLALHSYIENSKYEKSYANDEFIREYISKLRYANLNVSIKSARDIDRIWERDFSKMKSWRELGSFPGYVGEIAREINLIKNRHLLCLIGHFTGQNKKVLVVNNSDSLLALKK